MAVFGLDEPEGAEVAAAAAALELQAAFSRLSEGIHSPPASPHRAVAV
jgi:hypothetical protein